MKQLRNVKVLVVCALMAALAVALKFVASIDIGNYVRIGFSNLPGEVVSVMFGPVVGGVFWGVLDLIKYFLAPNGPFFPGFTLTAIVSGVIYGLVLYKKPVSVQRVFLATLGVKVFSNLILNTIWVVVLYGEVLSVILPARIISNLVMLPIDTAITFILLKAIIPLWNRVFGEEERDLNKAA